MSGVFNKAAQVLRDIAGFQPKWIVELGSGLYSCIDNFSICGSLKYAEIPDFEIPTTPGHTGVVYFSDQCGGVFLFCGRTPGYENVSFQQEARILFLASILHPTGLYLCSSCGATSHQYKAGTIIIARDVLNTQLSRLNLSRRFPKQFQRRPQIRINIVNDEIIKDLEMAGLRCGIDVQKGVLATVSGPSYETRAEVRALRKMGADAVTMSFGYLSATFAKFNIKPVIIGGITNIARDGSTGTRLTHERVVRTATEIVSPNLSGLLLDYFRHN